MGRVGRPASRCSSPVNKQSGRESSLPPCLVPRCERGRERRRIGAAPALLWLCSGIPTTDGIVPSLAQAWKELGTCGECVGKGRPSPWRRTALALLPRACPSPARALTASAEQRTIPYKGMAERTKAPAGLKTLSSSPERALAPTAWPLRARTTRPFLYAGTGG